MRSLVFGWCALLCSPFVWAIETPKDFIQEMPKEQRVLLNDYLRTVVASSAGYVLFGDRPMSIETCDAVSLRSLGGPSPKTVTFIKGRELWEDLCPISDTKEYILTFFDTDKNCNMVCINRKAFLQTVNENIYLFRYVLGPSVTAESLLKKVISSKNQFYSVLNHDQTLLGLLLGQGKQNALISARLLNISDSSVSEQKDEFPLLSKKLNLSWASSSKKYRKLPSFGFSSLNDEETALHKWIVSFDKLKAFDVCPLPHFACVSDSEETKALLSAYEQTRAKLVKELASKSFLENSLKKLLTSSNGQVEMPSIPRRKNLCLPSNKEDTVRKLTEIIHNKIAAEPYGVKKFQQAFLQGVTARESGKKMPIPPHLKRSNDTCVVQRELECCKNLEQANAYFKHLATREDLVALIPNEIYYKTLKTGKGNTASHKTNTVSFQYSFQILGDPNSKDAGIVKQENLGALIPGVAYALIGMQQGEERVVYIHPKHAYGEDTFFPPNISIAVQLRLLDFREGEQSVAIFPPHQLEQRDYKDLLAKFEVLRGEEIFDHGVEFWDAIKKSGDYIDFQTFQKLYTSNIEIQGSFSNQTQEDQFLVDLEYLLLSLQNKNLSE